MEWKNEPRSAGREDRVEPAEGYVASAGQTISRDTLLAQALAHVAACTDDVLPPEGFEARLMAAAEKQELFSPATAVPANGERRAPAPRRASAWVQRWAWAPVALAALALAFWIGTPRQFSPTPSGQPYPLVATAENRPGSSLAVPNRSARDPQPRDAAIPAPSVRTASGARPKRRPSAVRPAGQAEPVPATLAASAKESAPPPPRYSEFVPLEFASAFPVGEPLQTVRVRMDANAFLRWSLPGSAVGLATQLAHNGRVTADFLVGDDGSPRAIRLVNMDE